MENISQIGQMRSRLAAETAERAQLITALLPAAEDAASYDLYVFIGFQNISLKKITTVKIGSTDCK